MPVVRYSARWGAAHPVWSPSTARARLTWSLRRRGSARATFEDIGELLPIAVERGLPLRTHRRMVQSDVSLTVVRWKAPSLWRQSTGLAAPFDGLLDGGVAIGRRVADVALERRFVNFFPGAATHQVRLQVLGDALAAVVVEPTTTHSAHPPTLTLIDVIMV